MDKFHKPRTHKDRTKYDRKNMSYYPDLPEQIEDPDWGQICEVIDDMTEFEKMDFLRARIGTPTLELMDRDEYDDKIGYWLLNEWPELPLTENVGT